MPWGGGDSSSSGSSSGASSGSGFSGGSQSRASAAATKSFTSRRFRRAIESGDVASVKQYAAELKLTRAQAKGLVDFTRQVGGNSILNRLGRDLSGSVTAIPSGVYGIGKAAVQEGILTPVEDISHGRFNPLKDVPFSPVGLTAGFIKGALSRKVDKSQPLSSSFGASFRNTEERITHPRQLIHDYSAHPLNAPLEDIANLSIVAGPLAKAAKLGGFERTAAALERGSEVGNKIASGPFIPVSAAARGANKLIGRGSELAAQSERLRPLMEAMRMTPEQRSVRQVLRGASEEIGTASNRQVRLARQVEKLVPTKVEQEAMFVVGQGEAEALAALRKANPERFDDFVREQFKGSLSVEGAHLAANVVDGRAPQLKTHIDEALRIGREGVGGRAAREEAYLTGSASREAQTGFDALPTEVQAAVKKPAAKLAKAQRLAEQLRLKADAAVGRLARAQSEAEFIKVPAEQQIGTGNVSHYIKGDVTAAQKLGRERARHAVLESAAVRAEKQVTVLQRKVQVAQTNAEHAIQSAPARLRPVLSTNRAVVSELTRHQNALQHAGLTDAARLVDQAAGEIPVTLDALRSSGVNPDHFIHVQVGGAEQPTMGNVSSPNLPQVRKPRSARERKGQSFERTVRAQARGEIDELRAGIQRQTAEKLAALPFVKKVGGLGAGIGTATREELLNQGWVAWDPRSFTGKATTITPDTVLLPKPVFESFQRYFSPSHFDRALGIVYDPMTRVFKTAVLPLSLSWQVGNAVGNTLMAVIGGGVNPATLAKNVVKSIAEYRRTGEFAGPERLYSSGATHETLDYLGGRVPAEIGKVHRIVGAPLRKVVNLGYKANQFVDDVGRSAVYMAKKSKGYSDEIALRQALRAMGDFTNLSQFERRYVRRIIPFYSWQKHMTKLALTMPVEHPLRTAWTLHLANEFNDQDAWAALLPTYARAFVPLGGANVLQASNLFPFSTPFSLFTNPGQNLSPQLKLLLANLPGQPAQGINALTGRPYSRPAGTGRLDEYGKPLPTAPSILQQLRGIPPQLRFIDAITGRKDIARYDTGEPVLVRNPATGKREPIKLSNSQLTAITRMFGVPLIPKGQLKGQVKSIITGQVATRGLKYPQPKLTKSSSSTKSGWGN